MSKSTGQGIRIWYGNLRAYNEGRLVGKWIELPMDEEELKSEMLSITPEDEEYFLADWECGLEGFVSEYSNPFRLNQVAEEIEGLEEKDFIKVNHLVEYCNYSLDDAICKVDDVIFYEGMSLKQVAEELVDEGCFGELSEVALRYFDYEALARDLDCSGEYYSDSSGVFYHC